MSETSSPKQFLQEELAYAERHLARLRRIAAAMEETLAAQGLDEAAVYEKLSANKAYRQLHRDQAIFQQMWIRCHRHLLRFAPPTEPSANATGFPAAQPQTVRYSTPPPGRNAPCPCGSTFKYKRCCGNPLRQQPLAA